MAAAPIVPAAGNASGVPRDIVVGRAYLVARAGGVRPAVVLNSRVGRLGAREVYVSFVGEDKRLDTWVGVEAVGAEAAEAGPSRLPRNETTGTGAGTADPPAADGSVVGKENGAGGSSTAAEEAPTTTPTPAAQRRRSALASLAPPAPPRAPSSSRSTPEREHELVTRVRNFEDVRFGEYLVKTWYYSPYPFADGAGGGGGGADALGGEAAGSRRGRKRKDPPIEVGAGTGDAKAPASAGSGAGAGAHASAAARHHVLSHGVGQGGEGARGRLWVCDLCFKYMRTRAGWERHTAGCAQMQPPGRKAYQRDNYTIWEVDGAAATLYAQNLSLFGKLFIDHKARWDGERGANAQSVFFHVENFVFYVLCDAATSRRDQAMAFFSKEKTSYDDYNLACIVTFPPFQNRGFGKLLIEFSYYLTRAAASPGTPERPLSDLGLKGYLAFWAAVVLRTCRALLADAEAGEASGGPASRKPRSAVVPTEGRSLRTRRPETAEEAVVLNGTSMTKRVVGKGQYTVTTTLADLARACHLRTDDVVLTLTELGLLRTRRHIPSEPGATGSDADELGEWAGVEVVVARDAVDAAWETWRVRPAPVLDERFCL